jgi:hypothetical protein
VSEQQEKLVKAQAPNGKEMGVQDVLAAVKEKNWTVALKGLFSLIFGAQHDVKGLGLFVENVDAIPLRERAGLLTQLRFQRGGQVTANDLLKASVLTGSLEASLLKKGYRKIGESKPKTVIELKDPTTLRQLVSAKKLNDEILKKDNEDPLVLGVLSADLDKPLPTGFLHVDKEGYPLCVTKKNLTATAGMTFPLYRKDKALEAEAKDATKLGIEVLKQNLRRGDILLVSQGGPKQNRFQHSFQLLARAASSKGSSAGTLPFHGTHVMVFDGSNIAHLNWQGVKRMSVDAAFRDTAYNAVTIVRVRGAQQEAFAKRVEEKGLVTADGKGKKYDYRGLIEQGAERLGLKNIVGSMTSRLGPANTDDKGICVSVVTDAADGILPNLAKARTPMDIAQSEDVHAVVSVDLGKEVEPKQS